MAARSFVSGLLGLLIVAGVAWPSPAHAGELEKQIEALTSAPEYRTVRWGLLAVDLKTGEPILERNADQLFAPASVTKLYTCAAALAALGADCRFETTVRRRGNVVEGRLAGDLILVAGGDLTLGGRTDSAGKLTFRNHDHTYANWLASGAELTPTDPLAGLKDLARQVKTVGIQEVDGEVLIDDRLFNRERGSGSGPDLLTPIMVNDNVVDLVITPGVAVGEPAEVKMVPGTKFFRLDADVHTVLVLLRPRIRIESPDGRKIKVTGQVPFGSKPVVRIFAVPDPARFARALFIEALTGEGIKVHARAGREPRELLPAPERLARLPRVASFQSPPLGESLKVILKVSHNLHASTLPLLLAVKNGKHSLADGMRLQGRTLAELGVPVETISLESGAGGGNADKVSPRATVQLLRAMSSRPDFAVYRDALPVLGVDGTLAEVVGKNSPAKGKVQAKTGTYTDVDLLNDRILLRSKALAGYLTTKSGRQLAFAFFVNNVVLPRGVETTREGRALGRLCEITYQQAP